MNRLPSFLQNVSFSFFFLFFLFFVSEDSYIYLSRETLATVVDTNRSLIDFCYISFPSPLLLARTSLPVLDAPLYISFVLAQSGQMMSSPSAMKPRPTSEVLQPAQMKQSLCQCLSSKEMKRVPPMPEISETKKCPIIQLNLMLFLSAKNQYNYR